MPVQPQDGNFSKSTSSDAFAPSEPSPNPMDSNLATSPKMDQSHDESTPLVSTEKSINNTKKAVPKDLFFIALAIFFIQGMGTLFPWNAFISAPDYFIAIYGKDVMLYFGICYSIPNILSLAFMTFFGKKFPLLLLSVPPYVIMFLCLVAMPVMMVTGLSPLLPYGLIVTFILIITCGLLTAAVQGGVFGFAGIMPGKYMTAVMSGNGVAGLFVAVLRIITKVAIERHGTKEEQKWSVVTFFAVASIVLVVCIVSYFIVLKLPVVKYYLKASSEEDKKEEEQDDEEDEIDSLLNGHTERLNADEDEDEAIYLPKEEEEKKVSVISVFKKVWIQALEVFLTFMITLAIFPGLCTAIPTKYPDSFMSDGWLPIFMVLQFNLFDTIGRTFPIISDKINKVIFRFIHIPVFLRIIFLPLFCLALRPPPHVEFLGNDIVALCLMMVMAFTNGLFSSILMRFGPTKVESHEGRAAGTMMTFFLVGGIVAGTNLGTLVTKLVMLGADS